METVIFADDNLEIFNGTFFIDKIPAIQQSLTSTKNAGFQFVINTIQTQQTSTAQILRSIFP
jgi:hypothetical protein